MLNEKKLSVKSTRVSDLLTIRENYKKHAETFRTIARARKDVISRVKEAARDFGAYLVTIEYIDADRFNSCVDNLEKHFAEYNTDAEARRVAKQYIEDINRRIEYGIKNRCAALVQDQLDKRGIITDVEARAILKNVRDYCANFDDVRGGFEVEVRDAKKCYTCRVWSNDTRRKILVYTSTGAGIMNEGQVEYLKSNGYTGDGVLEANLTQKTLDAAFYVGSITSAARRVVELQYFSVENQPVETFEHVETVEPVENPDDVLTEEEKVFLNKIDWNKSDAKNADKSTQPETTPAAPVVVEETPAETVEEVEEIDDDDDETGDDDAEETTEEKERALELVAASTVERLGAGVVAWRHLTSNLDAAPRSWDRLRPYSLNNTLIIESTPETHGARLLITLDRADVKEDGESVIDWAQYDDAGADVWQPKKFKFIPLKDEHGELIKDDDGKILATRKVSKYGKVTIHDADLFPWLEKKRAQKYAQLEKIVASEIKERDAKRAALLGATSEKWASNLAQIVKRFFDGTKLTTERAALGQEIARAFIASRLGFDLQWDADTEKEDAARLLALCTQGDKKHGTTGHALQVVLKHVNKCVASILYQSQTTAIKPREEKPAPVPTVEEKQPAASVKNDDEEMIVSALESFEEEATQAKNTFGLVHQDNARRAENDALLAIEEARKNKSVPDDALKIYSDRVERIHVDTAIALKEEASRRYGAEFIDRHVTFC